MRNVNNGVPNHANNGDSGICESMWMWRKRKRKRWIVSNGEAAPRLAHAGEPRAGRALHPAITSAGVGEFYPIPALMFGTV